MQEIEQKAFTLTPTCVYRSEAFGGVLFDLETKQYLLVNRIGYEIVDFLATQAASLDGLVDDVVVKVSSMLGQPVKSTQIAEAVEQFLAELAHNGFMVGYPLRVPISQHQPLLPHRRKCSSKRHWSSPWQRISTAIYSVRIVMWVVQTTSPRTVPLLQRYYRRLKC